jgi:hypothetical protein
MFMVFVRIHGLYNDRQADPGYLYENGDFPYA